MTSRIVKIGWILKNGGKDYLDNHHMIMPNGDIYERSTKDIDGWNWVRIND